MAVLVTTDGSERSLAALPHAALLASRLETTLVLGHVVDPLLDLGHELATDLGVAAANVVERSRRKLDVLLDEAGLSGDVVVTLKRPHETLPEALLRSAHEAEASVIAMATRGAGAVRHAVLGSTALGLLSATDLPVLVTGDHIRPPGTGAPYRLVITTDGSPASEAALRAMGATLPPSSALVTLLRVCEPGPDRDAAEGACRAELEAARALMPPDLDVAPLLRQASAPIDVPAVILDVANDVNADVIAMATHGHSALRHLFAGSVALAVLSRSERPLILVRSRV